jgi:hypothetical protein
MRNLLLRMFEGPACLVYALVLVALSVGATSGQSSAGSAKVVGMTHGESPLKVTLKTDRDSYKLGDEITVQVLLTNKSKSPVYIYASLDWGESASLSLWLKDAISGKDVPEEFIPDALSPPPGSKDAFVKLLPDHVYGVVLRSKLAELNVQKSGTYELVAGKPGDRRNVSRSLQNIPTTLRFQISGNVPSVPCIPVPCIQYDTLSNTPDTRYSNKEERRVIRNYENPAARQLGESPRYNHAGTPYTVNCPTCR